MMLRMITVGQLRETIKDLPDDTSILSYLPDVKKNGYKGISCASTRNPVSERIKTYDAFDYMPYSYTVRFLPLKKILALSLGH